MAPSDCRRVPVECGGAIGVFGIGGQTGEVDVLGFAQGAGRHRLSRIHDEREGEKTMQETTITEVRNGPETSCSRS